MNRRIKELRKVLRLTQQEFANRIQISRGALAVYEIGRNEPIDAVVSLICREFNVSERWLRTGDGEMFVEPPEFSLDDFAKQCSASELDLKIVKKYFELPADIRHMLVDHFKSIFVEEPSSISGTGGHGWVEEEKTSIPVFKDGLENTAECLMKFVPHLNLGQQQMLVDQVQRMIEQQKKSTSPDVPLIAENKAPESEIPGQS